MEIFSFQNWIIFKPNIAKLFENNLTLPNILEEIDLLRPITSNHESRSIQQTHSTYARNNNYTKVTNQLNPVFENKIKRNYKYEYFFINTEY